jgi:hypothetical protein
MRHRFELLNGAIGSMFLLGVLYPLDHLAVRKEMEYISTGKMVLGYTCRATCCHGWIL